MRRPGPLRYPAARRGDEGEVHHGEWVADPYRWLEDVDAPEVDAWIDAQNVLTEAFLAAVPTREEIRVRLTELWNHPKAGIPFEKGGTWFQFRDSGLQNQPVLHVGDEPGAEGRTLLDPNGLSDDGTIAVTSLAVSHDGSLLAYATSAAGSDWRTWRVRVVATGRDLPDVVEWSKFTGATWLPDGSGFFYGAPEAPLPGGEYTDRSRSQRIFLHRLGTAQSDDLLEFGCEDPEWGPEARVSDDGRYLVVTIHRGTFPEARIEVRDLGDPGAGFRPLVPDFGARASVAGNRGSTFFLVTDDGADRGRVVAVDLDRPEPRHWRAVVPETADVLVEALVSGGRLVCHFLRDATSVLRVHTLEGAHVRDVPLPAMSALGAELAVEGEGAEGFHGRAGSDLVHVGVTSFADPGSIWSHDLSSGETRLVQPSASAVQPGRFVVEQVFVPSPDGTSIPLFLARRRDLEPTGAVPALLYGYGGFGVPTTPAFRPAFATWMERGGLLAVAALRGGGEYGSAWHDAGRLANKQNVFDDFCACARWLAQAGWSRPDRIAIHGGSNGGLLVGACLTQHPELFGAAAASVGVFDMLRFHRFTIGWAWTSDFGDPDDPEQYRWVRAYSPLHNVPDGASFPPTLLATGDHDDRVVPGHSLKFAAALQSAQGGEAPVLLRVDRAAGHGLGKPTAKRIAEQTDLLAFLEAALGVAGAGAGPVAAG